MLTLASFLSHVSSYIGLSDFIKRKGVSMERSPVKSGSRDEIVQRHGT
jgi:hypothetical protein